MSSDEPVSNSHSSTSDDLNSELSSAFRAETPAVSDEVSQHPMQPTSVSKPRLWTVLLTVFAATLVYLMVSVICLVLALIMAAAISGGDTSKRSSEELMEIVFTHPASILFLLVPGHLAILAIAVLAAVFSPSPFASRLSLNRPSWPWWTTVAAVLAAPLCSLLWSIVISGFVDSSEYLETMAKMFRSTTDGFGFGVTLLCIAVMPAFSEEWLFRGYVQTRLAQRWSPWLAILVSSLLFAAFHMEPVHVLAVLPIGLWFGFISWRCASIIPAMLAHAYNNTLSLIGVIYDQADSLDASISSFSNQVTVFLGLPALLVFIGYLIVCRSRTEAMATVGK